MFTYYVLYYTEFVIPFRLARLFFFSPQTRQPQLLQYCFDPSIDMLCYRYVLSLFRDVRFILLRMVFRAPKLYTRTKYV